MTRKDIRESLKRHRPPVITPDLFDDPLQKRIVRMLNDMEARYVRAKRAILADRSLSEREVSRRWDKAFERWTADSDRVRPLERRAQRQLIRLLQKSSRSSGTGKTRRSR